MSDFATYARRINEELAAGSVKLICRSIVALVAAGLGDDFLKGLADFMAKRPLTAPQIDAAKKTLLRKVGTLARLAVAASKKTAPATAPAAPLTAAKPEPAPEPAKPSALPPRGQKRPPRVKQPKQPKLPKPARVSKGTTAPFHSPDVNGMSPWEADDAAYAAECEVMAMEAMYS
jgi:hypothetical protein